MFVGLIKFILWFGIIRVSGDFSFKTDPVSASQSATSSFNFPIEWIFSATFKYHFPNAMCGIDLSFFFASLKVPVPIWFRLLLLHFYRQVVSVLSFYISLKAFFAHLPFPINVFVQKFVSLMVSFFKFFDWSFAVYWILPRKEFKIVAMGGGFFLVLLSFFSV